MKVSKIIQSCHRRGKRVDGFGIEAACAVEMKRDCHCGGSLFIWKIYNDVDVVGFIGFQIEMPCFAY
jgi:hypothetical protein